MQGKQGRLFDHLPIPDEFGQQVRIVGSSKHLDPAQRTFNRLSDEVARLQEDIQRWQQRITRLAQRVEAEMLPRIDEMKRAQRELALQIDRVLTTPKLRLSKAKRDSLGDYIFLLTEEISGADADPEITALRERYLGLSQQEEVELERELAREMLGGMFGEEVLEGYTGDDVAEMIAHAKARHEEKSRPQGRRRTKKAIALEEAKETADTALREAYRKLASHLHPDREQDAMERERKTALMQQANAAYERRDLMGLLRLQMECAQLDADALGELPEARIKRYIQALREQIKTLEGGRRALIQAAAESLGVLEWSLVTADDARLDALYAERLQDLQHHLDHLRSLIDDLASASRRDAAIKSILSELEEAEIDALAAMWAFTEDEVEAYPSFAARKAKRKTRKAK